MPQLDTSTWLITILSMILTLLIVFQLKILKFNYPLSPMLNLINKHLYTHPWETKWTKIYLPHSLPQQS
uniref:ATP synthase complex subunit 8 n=2 Tax=Varecia variegata TaxID=9455 RepID=A0A0A7DF18_VARVI|nr:ATP synthase F0 subunit 8 [Varecia variegata variegata]AII98369.1 ATP synthase F0 subunit 8 [Varecia variegata]AII98511.1 ATP synthase F0 subunit 8 [Varecia variegata]AII98537.1 ATP synthase F0 subunit 8 [Varecia variegata]AII98819.1 ATP synthase F0 subunit 8 [Varecia variegata]AII98998.1 ATP synthase F0 subunit 8 [Varecia variegata]